MFRIFRYRPAPIFELTTQFFVVPHNTTVQLSTMALATADSAFDSRMRSIPQIFLETALPLLQQGATITTLLDTAPPTIDSELMRPEPRTYFSAMSAAPLSDAVAFSSRPIPPVALVVALMSVESEQWERGSRSIFYGGTVRGTTPVGTQSN
ncbi:hypothetical protein EIP86_004122 [Pleurotus ostreatoroseus]|nr:hypothetical protein EIP86_004122 [Pleurotus ostreatoroseus]